jgi:hypothetical protein
MILNYEFVTMWKEAVMADFKVLSQYLSRGTTENFSQDIHPLGQESNPEYCEC